MPTLAQLSDNEKTLLAQYLATKGVAPASALTEIQNLLAQMADGRSIYSVLAPLLPNGIPLNTNWSSYLPILNGGGAGTGDTGTGGGGGQGGQGAPGGRNYEAAEPFNPFAGNGGGGTMNLLNLAQSLFKPLETAPGTPATPGAFGIPQVEQTYFPVQPPPDGGFMDIEPLFPDSQPIGMKVGNEPFGPPTGRVSDSGLISRDVKTVPIGADGKPQVGTKQAVRASNLPDAQYGFDGALTPEDPNSPRLDPSNGGVDPVSFSTRPSGPKGRGGKRGEGLPNALPEKAEVDTSTGPKGSATVPDSLDLGSLFSPLPEGPQGRGGRRGNATVPDDTATPEDVASLTKGRGLTDLGEEGFGGGGSTTLIPSVRPVTSMPLDPITGQPQYDLAERKAAADATLAGTFEGALAGPKFMPSETVDQMYAGIFPPLSLDQQVDQRINPAMASLDQSVSDMMNFFNADVPQAIPPTSVGIGKSMAPTNTAPSAARSGASSTYSAAEAPGPANSGAMRSAPTQTKAASKPAAPSSVGIGKSSTSAPKAPAASKPAAPSNSGASKSAPKSTSAPAKTTTTTTTRLNKGMY